MRRHERFSRAGGLLDSGYGGWCASARGSIRGGVRGVRKRTFRNSISGKDFEAKKFVSAPAPPEETKETNPPRPQQGAKPRAGHQKHCDRAAEPVFSKGRGRRRLAASPRLREFSRPRTEHEDHPHAALAVPRPAPPEASRHPPPSSRTG